MTDQRAKAEEIVSLWVNERKDRGARAVHEGVPLGSWLPDVCSDLVERIDAALGGTAPERTEAGA